MNDPRSLKIQRFREALLQSRFQRRALDHRRLGRRKLAVRLRSARQAMRATPQKNGAFASARHATGALAERPVPSTGTSPSRTTGATGASMPRSPAHGPPDGILFRRARRRSSVATRPSPRRHPPMPMSCESRNEPPLRGRSSGSRRRPPASCRLPSPRAFLAARESAARFGNCGKPRGELPPSFRRRGFPIVPRPRNESVFAVRPPRRVKNDPRLGRKAAFEFRVSFRDGNASIDS